VKTLKLESGTSRAKCCSTLGTVYPVDTLEEAIDQVATKSIRYMKNDEKKVLKDFSYAQLER